MSIFTSDHTSGAADTAVTIIVPTFNEAGNVEPLVEELRACLDDERGYEILCEIFLRAGAERVLPMIVGCDEIRSDADLQKLREMKLSAGDFEVTAYHPLGTCRMGVDPTRSCVGPDGEAHDTEGLFVADGSAIPSSLGVNPQLTIMALASRTAEHIAQAAGASTTTQQQEIPA